MIYMAHITYHNRYSLHAMTHTPYNPMYTIHHSRTLLYLHSPYYLVQTLHQSIIFQTSLPVQVLYEQFLVHGRNSVFLSCEQEYATPWNRTRNLPYCKWVPKVTRWVMKARKSDNKLMYVIIPFQHPAYPVIVWVVIKYDVEVLHEEVCLHLCLVYPT